MDSSVASVHDADGVPSEVQNAVLKKSVFNKQLSIPVKGFDFDERTPVDLDHLMASMMTTGFQATNVALAINEINRMLSWRLSDRPILDSDPEDFKSDEYRRQAKCTIFLAYTSNIISSGLRETIKFLAKHNLVFRQQLLHTYRQ